MENSQSLIRLISRLPSTCTINKLILLKDDFSKFSVHFANWDNLFLGFRRTQQKRIAGDRFIFRDD